ncbi:hypothetical protein Ctob_014055, partial [Chrysochromulina tobinii]
QSLHSPIARALRASESLKALPAPAQPSPNHRRPTMPRPLHPSQSEALLQRPLNFRAQDMPTRHRSQPTALEIALIASAGVRAEARHSVQEQVQLLEKLVGIDRPSVRALLVLSNKAITSLQTSTEALEAEALSMYYALSSAFEQQRRVADGAMQELKNQQMQYEDALSTMRTEFLANRKKLQQALGEVDELGKTLAEQERLAREREAKALDIQAAAHASVVENWKRALETQEASSTKQIDELKASLQDAEKGRKQAVADKEAAKKEFNELSRQLKEK